MGNKTRADMAKDLDNLKQYLASKGLSEQKIERIIKRTSVRDLDLVKIRMEHDYPKILHTDVYNVAQMVGESPKMLGFEVIGDKPTSIENKLKVLQKLLQVDEKTILSFTIKNPKLLGSDMTKNIATSLETLRNELKIDQTNLIQIVFNFPEVFFLNINAVIEKLKKMSAVMSKEKALNSIVNNSRLFGVPVNEFKFRYMLAEIIGMEEQFLKYGFLRKLASVWARFCYLISNDNRSMSYVYSSESAFKRWIGVKTKDLEQKYRLTPIVFNYIEQEYNRIQAQQEDKQKLCYLKFDSQELAARHLKRCACDLIVPEEMGRSK